MSKIVLVGAGASGKDYLKDKFSDKGFKSSVKYTTRPIREGEVDGETYHFITETSFKKLIEFEYFIVQENHIGWYYGISWASWQTDTIFVLTPSELQQAKENSTLDDVLILYLNVSEDIRRERLESRGDVDSPTRRLHTDYLDFKDFNLFDVEIKNF